jgi:hypothetical protein
MSSLPDTGYFIHLVSRGKQLFYPGIGIQPLNHPLCPLDGMRITRLNVFIFLGCSGFLALSFYQGNESKFLFWKPDIKLKWTDFQGHIKPEDDEAASASYIGFLHTIKKCASADSILLDTRSYFNRGKSWVKVPKVSPPLLAHEQLHFDLAELYARKFRKAMLDLKLTLPTLSKRIDSTYLYYLEASDSLHVLYDIQTEHGLNRTSQETWNEYVKGNLLQLSMYDQAALKLRVDK